MSREADAALREAYDALPYDARPYRLSHPARSAAAAAIFGLAPPDVRTARVLELGCSAGGNLIPLAAYYPDATFLGVDFSPVQVAQGRAHVAALGLTNVEIREASFADLRPEDGLFDYVVAHGVYSWVPDAARDELMRVCAENLAPAGVAYVSYNIYPGWHMKKIVRDLMLFHTLGIDDPRERVAAARRALDEVCAVRSDTKAYQAILEQERDLLAGMDDFYIFHESLEHENHPVYVLDFIEAARARGLAYLCEAEVPITLPECYPWDVARRVRDDARRFPPERRFAAMQQYMDFAFGRTFRMSLLVKAGQEGRVDRRVTPERLDGLHFRATRPITQSSTPEGAALLAEGFADGFAEYASGPATVRVDSAEGARLLARLADPAFAARGTFTLRELARATFGERPDGARLRATGTLLVELFRRQILEAWSTPLRWGGDDVERPEVHAIVRGDAAAGRPFSTLQAHTPLTFAYPSTRALIALLDGTRTRAEAAAELAAAVRAGTLTLRSRTIDLSGVADPDEAARRYVDAATASFAELCMLRA